MFCTRGLNFFPFQVEGGDGNRGRWWRGRRINKKRILRGLSCILCGGGGWTGGGVRTVCATRPRGNKLLIYCRKTDHYIGTRKSENDCLQTTKLYYMVYTVYSCPSRVYLTTTATIAGQLIRLYTYIYFIIRSYFSLHHIYYIPLV